MLLAREQGIIGERHDAAELRGVCLASKKLVTPERDNTALGIRVVKEARQEKKIVWIRTPQEQVVCMVGT